MATKPTRIEVNCETGEVQEIALTSEEIAEQEQRAADFKLQEAARLLAEEAKAVAKASAEEIAAL